MTTSRFQQNLRYLLNILTDTEETINFLIKKNAFSEQFVKLVTESDLLTKQFEVEYKHDINQIIGQIGYELSLKNKKINVDITKNKVFSYYDSEEQLLYKMKNYIENEDFENAVVLDKYLKLIDVKY